MRKQLLVVICYPTVRERAPCPEENRKIHLKNLMKKQRKEEHKESHMKHLQIVRCTVVRTADSKNHIRRHSSQMTPPKEKTDLRCDCCTYIPTCPHSANALDKIKHANLRRHAYSKGASLQFGIEARNRSSQPRELARQTENRNLEMFLKCF